MHFLNWGYKQSKAFDSLLRATFPKGSLGPLMSDATSLGLTLFLYTPDTNF